MENSKAHITFFYTCPNYRDVRCELADTLVTYSSQELLFGRESASDQENELLFFKGSEFYNQIETLSQLVFLLQAYYFMLLKVLG